MSPIVSLPYHAPRARIAVRSRLKSRERHQIMREYSSANPTLKPRKPCLQTTVESKHALQIRKRSFNAGPKALPELEQTAVFPSIFRFVARSLFWNCDSLYAQRFRRFDRLLRIESFVRCTKLGSPSEDVFVGVQGRYDQASFCWTLEVRRITGDQAAFDLLDFNHVSKLNLLSRLASLDQFRVRFKDAENLFFIGNGRAVQHSLRCLMNTFFRSLGVG